MARRRPTCQLVQVLIGLTRLKRGMTQSLTGLGHILQNGNKIGLAPLHTIVYNVSVCESRISTVKTHERTEIPMSGAKKKSERRASLAEMGLTEREKKELKDKQIQKRNTILATIGGVIAVVLVVALLVWNSGVIPRHTTALTVKDHNYSVADMDYYFHQALNSTYSQQQTMAQFYEQNNLGEYEVTLDPNGDLKAQYVDDAQTQTYYDYFIEQAKTNMVQVTALYDAAKAANHTLSEEAQEQMDTALTDLDAAVAQYNFGSRSAYLKAVFGRNMTEKTYLKNVEMSVLAYDYSEAMADTMKDYSDDELNAYYAENTDTLDSYDYDFVYFDGTVQPTTDADGNQQEVTDEQKTQALDQAKADADAMLEAVKNAGAPAEGEQPKTFATIATDMGKTASVRTSTIGSDFSTMPFAEWLMDASRKDGDTEVFEMEGYGYYVAQFHDRYRNDDPTMDVRHILCAFEADEETEHEHDENGNHVYTDAEKQAAHDEAQSILDQFNQGEKTSEAFAALAEEHSDDGRDETTGELNAEGGLYEKVKPSDNYVQPWLDWIFADGRKVGDTGLVETDYGWHIMYLDAYNRPAWMDAAESGKSSDDQTAFMEQVQEGYEAVDGSGIARVGLS